MFGRPNRIVITTSIVAYLLLQTVDACEEQECTEKCAVQKQPGACIKKPDATVECNCGKEPKCKSKECEKSCKEQFKEYFITSNCDIASQKCRCMAKNLCNEEKCREFCTDKDFAHYWCDQTQSKCHCQSRCDLSWCKLACSSRNLTSASCIVVNRKLGEQCNCNP